MNKNLWKLSKEKKYAILDNLCMSTPDMIDYLTHTLNEGLQDEVHTTFHEFWFSVKSKLEDIRDMYNH